MSDIWKNHRGVKDESLGHSPTAERIRDTQASNVKGRGILGAIANREDLVTLCQNFPDNIGKLSAVRSARSTPATKAKIQDGLKRMFAAPVIENIPDVLPNSKLTLWTWPTISAMQDMADAFARNMKGDLIAEPHHIPASPEYHIFDKAPLFKGSKATMDYWGVDINVGWIGTLALPIGMRGTPAPNLDSPYPKSNMVISDPDKVNKTASVDFLNDHLKGVASSTTINLDPEVGGSFNEIGLENHPKVFFEVIFQGSKSSTEIFGIPDRSVIVCDILVPLDENHAKGMDWGWGANTPKDYRVSNPPILSVHPFGPGENIPYSPMLNYILMRQFLKSKVIVAEPPKKKARKALSKLVKAHKVDDVVLRNGIFVTCLRDASVARMDGESKTAYAKRIKEYSHRWQVSGHYRNQYYPSTGEYKRIMIKPYVKGPKDKPLIVKERVYKVTR